MLAEPNTHSRSSMVHIIVTYDAMALLRMTYMCTWHINGAMVLETGA